MQAFEAYDPQQKRNILMLYALANGVIYEFHGTFWCEVMPLTPGNIKNFDEERAKLEK